MPALGPSLLRTFALVLVIAAGGRDAAGVTGGRDELRSGWPGVGPSRSCPDDSSICTWERTYGGRLAEKAYAVTEMADGGFAVAGHTLSHGRPRTDAVVVRFDRAGKVLWQRVFGGPATEQLYGIVALADGGVAVAGHTRSRGAGQSDVWIVRLDADGRRVWQRRFGGPANDRARSIAAAPDGGVVVAGFTRSRGAGDGDAWLLRLDRHGELIWDSVYGAEGDDGAYNVIPLPGGGFAVAGYSQGLGREAYELWVLWVDDRGWVKWERRFRRGMFAAATGLTPAANGGLYVVGLSHRSSSERPNVWVMHLDRYGAFVWQKVVGGPKSDGGWGLAATADGGFVVLAATASRGAGSTDAWLMRFDPAGKLLWERLYGGALWDRPTAILVTRDGGLMVTGYTTSQGTGEEDIWLLRLDHRGRLGPSP